MRLLRSCLAAFTLFSYTTRAFTYHRYPMSSSVRPRKSSNLLQSRNKHRDMTTVMKSTETSTAQLADGNSVGIKNTLAIIKENQSLQRKHERVLFAVYLVAGLALKRGMIGKELVVVQSTIALVWMTFSLAISFMEAWVKFKAPLLRKNVAVDVGRHVFAAQHAVELGLAIAFWSGPLDVRDNLSMYYPAMIGTVMYLILSFVVGPLLYFRAKHKMVNEAVPEHLTAEEKATLDSISTEIEGKQLPNAKWHVVYVVLDAIKVVSLGIFARNGLTSITRAS